MGDRKRAHDGVLAIETSQARGSVAWSPALVSAPQVEWFSIGLVHAKELLPRIEALRTRVGFDRSDIDIVAVSAGPGSFTGVRIGVAATKAIAFGLGVPALAISSLAAIAWNAVESAIGDGDLAVVLDARRDQVYGARFRIAGEALVRISDDAVQPREAFASALPADTRLVGEGARTLAGFDAFDRAPEECDLARAESIVALARLRLAPIESGEDSPPPEFTDPHTLVPFYLRRTAAEEARDRRSM